MNEFAEQKSVREGLVRDFRTITLAEFKVKAGKEGQHRCHLIGGQRHGSLAEVPTLLIPAPLSSRRNCIKLFSC